MDSSLFVLTAFVVAGVAGGWWYFRHAQMNRPPIGVINMRDTVVLMIALVVMPYLYLDLPLVLVTVLLAIIALTALHMTLEAMVRRRLPLWLACLGLLAADIALGLGPGVESASFLLVNNVVLIIIVAGAANLWVQSGMRAHHVAVLAAMLTVYDIIATAQLSLMTDVLDRLTELPLMPLMAWGLPDQDTSLFLGLGDVLLVTLFPLVQRKAFGRTAGLVALGVGLAVVTVMLTLLSTGAVTTTIPVMAVLGPLIVGQYWYWRHARGTERTTWQYLRAEPLPVGN